MSQTYTKDILQKLELVLREAQPYELRDNVKTWKLGVLPVSPIFPCVAILPNEERVRKYFSDGLMTVSRSFDLEIYSSGFPAEKVEENNLKFLHEIERVLRLNTVNRVNNFWFDIQFNESIIKTQPIVDEGMNKFICASILPISVQTKNIIPIEQIINYDFDSLTISSTLSTTKVILEKIRQLFAAYRLSTFETNELYLGKIKGLEIVESKVEPVHGYVYILSAPSNIDRTYTGADTNEHKFEIHYISKALPKEAFLLDSLDVTRRLVEILQVYPFLGQSNRLAVSFTSQNVNIPSETYQEKIIDSEIESVQYTITPDRVFYDSKITYNITTRKISTL